MIDRKLAQSIRNMCPDGKGITSVVISTSGTEPITLTRETRDKIDYVLRKPGMESKNNQRERTMITKKTIVAALGLIEGLLNDHARDITMSTPVSVSLAFEKGNGPDMTDVHVTISYWPSVKVKDEAETTVSEKQGDMFEKE